MDRFGRIDILVNNAGIMVTKGVLETTEDDWDRTIDVNLKGAVPVLEGGRPDHDRASRAGRSSTCRRTPGLYHPSAMRFTEYVVSKAGMNGLTKAMALALGPYITVNAICPGWIRTDMVEVHRPGRPAAHPRRDGAAPLGHARRHRRLRPSSSPRPRRRFITGELLIVAGGRGMH